MYAPLRDVIPGKVYALAGIQYAHGAVLTYVILHVCNAHTRWAR